MAAINSVADLAIDGEVAVITIDSPPVNALSQAVRDGLKRGVEAAEANGAVKAIVHHLRRPDLHRRRGHLRVRQAAGRAHLPEVLDAMENASKPVVAALHGTALGGGFEVALTAHYRVAVPSAKFGLPEIKLGLIPGAGGTQRLPRLIGVEKALDVILSGTPFGAREAKEWGVVDELVEEGKLRESALAFARRLIAEKAPLRKVRDRSDKLAPRAAIPRFSRRSARRMRESFAASRPGRRRSSRCRNAVDLPFDEGMAKERADVHGAAADHAVQGAAPCVLRRAAGGEDRRHRRTDTPTMPIKSVGVIGAGTMGGGIAMNFLNAGIPVTIVETRAGGARPRRLGHPPQL